MYNELIFIAIIIAMFIYFNNKIDRNNENFSNTLNQMKEEFANTLDPNIVAAVNTIYQADIESIRNLSSFASSLMSGNQVIIPANVIIQGNLTISGNLTTTGNSTTTGTLTANGNLTANGTTTTNDIHINKDQWIRVHGQGGIFWQDYGGGWNMTDPTWVRSYNGKGVYVPTNLQVDGSVSANGGIYTSDWFRVKGNGGIYWENWGGGWNMTDPTWLRAYGNKNIYTAGQMRPDAGVIFDNNGQVKKGSGGGIVAICDGNGACGRMNNGNFDNGRF